MAEPDCPYSDAELAKLLAHAKTIALVGASNKPQRPSYQIMEFLQLRGWRVIPVNPQLAGSEILGLTVVSDLASAQAIAPIDLVNIFRKSEDTDPVIDESLNLKLGKIWLQLGIENQSGATRARKAGTDFIMNRCILIEVKRLAVHPMAVST